MFTGFNLKIDKDDESFFNSYFDDGQKLLASQKEAIQTSLESYICNNDILDGTKIQENWFHSVNADSCFGRMAQTKLSYKCFC